MKKLLTIILICLALIGNGTNYYVSTTGGNAGHTGLVGDPFLTLAYACSQVTTSGDVINVGAGTFTETAQCVVSVGVSIVGVVANPLTSIIRSGWANTSNNGLIQLSSATEGTNGNQSISYLKIDGVDFTSYYTGISVIKRSNVIIHHCEIINFYKYGCYFSGSSGEPTTYSTGNQFHHNVVTNCAMYSGAASGNFCIGGQQDILVEYNIITQTDRGINLNGYCIKYFNGFNKGLTIRYNTIAVPPRETSAWAFAIELWYQRGGIEIYGNDIQGAIDIGGTPLVATNDEGGYGFAVRIHDNTVGYNTLQHYELGIQFEGGTTGGCYVYKNLCKNLYKGIFLTSFNDADVIEDIYISYNVISGVGLNYTTGGKGIFVDGTYSTNSTFNNINILNNTIYGYRTGGGTSIFGIDIRMAATNTLTDIYVKNNIVSDFNTCMYVSGSVGIMDVYNNIYYGNSSNIPNYANAPTTLTESNNLTSNPLLSSVPTDYRLQVGSPAINAGVNVGLTTDYAGHTITGLPDVGAYEYYVAPIVLTKGISAGGGKAWGIGGVPYGTN